MNHSFKRKNIYIVGNPPNNTTPYPPLIPPVTPPLPPLQLDQTSKDGADQLHNDNYQITFGDGYLRLAGVSLSFSQRARARKAASCFSRSLNELWSARRAESVYFSLVL